VVGRPGPPWRDFAEERVATNAVLCYRSRRCLSIGYDESTIWVRLRHNQIAERREGRMAGDCGCTRELLRLGR